MAFSSSPLATAYPWLHRLPPRAPEEASWRHVGGCAGAWVQSGSGPPASTLSGSSSCRVQKLVAHRTLPGCAVHRGKFLKVPWLAFPASSSCRGLGLSTLFLNGLQGSHGGSWRSPGKPCRGVLQLPVHEFGILGYPYSSTPTGAPGPGPDTVPTAVGPGPKQCTGMRGLGHTAYLSAPTGHAQNGTRQTRRRGRDRGSLRGAKPPKHASGHDDGDGSRPPP